MNIEKLIKDWEDCKRLKKEGGFTISHVEFIDALIKYIKEIKK